MSTDVTGFISWLRQWFDDIYQEKGGGLGVDLVEIVSTLPTASASTMNKLYLVTKTGGSTGDSYNIYITVKSGTSPNFTYTWEKIDDFDLQDLPRSISDLETQLMILSNRLEYKAPTNHASPQDEYGLGTTSKYGHNKIRDNLTASTLVNGESLSAHQGYILKGLIDDLDSSKQDAGNYVTFDDVYPVGSIYMSVNNTSPSTLFGGTWVQLTDTFLYASTTSDANSTTATGGEATHTLTVNEMPSHTHTQNAHAHNAQHYAFLETNQGVTNSDKRKMSYSSGSYYYPYQSANGAWGRDTATANATATNQNTGGGQAHNNMPPYMKVYMWKRTA